MAQYLRAELLCLAAPTPLLTIGIAADALEVFETKVNVEVAGLSVPLRQSSLIALSPGKHCSHFQSSRSSTAIPPMTDAVEDSLPTLMDTSSRQEGSRPRLNTLTPLEVEIQELASLSRVKPSVPLLDTNRLVESLVSTLKLLRLLEDLFPSVLLLALSKITPEEC